MKTKVGLHLWNQRRDSAEQNRDGTETLRNEEYFLSLVVGTVFDSKLIDHWECDSDFVETR